MVHLNGRALPEFSQNSGSSSSTLYDDLRHVNALDDHHVRRHVPVSDEAASVQQTSTPRRVRSNQSVRGPKPLLPRSLKEALQLAELLSKSKLIPKGFETPETCLVGILYGMEVGLSPIAALQRMAVIDGRPTIWGDAALALVQASGLLQSIKENVVDERVGNGGLTADAVGQSSSTSILNLTAACTVKRAGRAEPITGTFSIEDAKRAGLWQKSGPWTDYPKRMLIMRARAFALRDAFPDVLAGLYIREEFEGAGKRYDQPSSASSNANEGCTDSTITPQSFTPTDLQAPKPPDSDQLKDHMHTVRRAPPPPAVVEETQNTVCDVCNPLCDPTHILSLIDNNPDEVLIGPEIVLDLFDSALCCALDLSTLEEIVDDFAGRLKNLSQDYQRRAQKIIDRHQKRVEDLDQYVLSEPDEVQGSNFASKASSDLEDGISKPELADQRIESAASDVATEIRNSEDQTSSSPDLPSGLRSLFPNLGLGTSLQMPRRRKRQTKSPRSVASWNARYRLPEFQFRNRNEDDNTTDTSESEE